MKTVRLLLLLVFLCPFSYLKAQNVPKTSSLGSSSAFIKSLKATGAGANARAASTGITIPLPGGTTLTATVNVVKTYGTTEVFSGKTEDATSLFNVSSKGGKIEGSIVIQNKKTAYTIYSDANNNTFVKETDINNVVCTEYVKSGASSGVAKGALPPGQSATNLQSYPSATCVVLLDFDGHNLPAGRWGDPVNAAASPMSPDEIYEAWQIASEDFSPFNLNITTNESVYFNAPANMRMRIIITPTNPFNPNWGGVAFLGSFTYGDDTPCWSFNQGAKGAGETISHEVGHTLGLNHDGTTTGSEYYGGQNNWAPIMGVGFSADIVQWSKGEYQSANNLEDDLALITANNGFGYRTDLIGNTGATATPLTFGSAGKILPAGNKGVIETSADVDVFSFTRTASGNVSLTVNPYVKNSDLDVLLTLKDANENIVTTSNNTDSLSTSLSLLLPAGTYYLFIEGTGKGSPLTQYSDYASIGEYFISGTIVNAAPTNLALNKRADGSSALAGNPFANAVDGSLSTRWESAFSDPQWILVDLKQTFAISRVKILWEAAYGKNYKIQTSNTNNGTDWVDIKTVSNNTTLSNDWTGLSGEGRYIRIYGTARGTGYGYSIFNLEVYGESANQLPVINFSSPGNNSVYTPNSTVLIVAAGYDPDGTITKVEFFNGVTKLGEDLTTPYTYSWTNVPVGSYTITAKATDNKGASSSKSIFISVVQSNPPTVTITSPANGSSFLVDQNITLSANAADSDGSISKVDFLLNGLLQNTIYSAPYSYVVTVSIPLTQTLTVIAYDNNGLKTTSSPVTFTVTAVPVFTNLALNKPATSSSVTGGNTAAKAVDGNGGTRWESLSADPQWITIDLQQTYSINRVKIAWEGAYGKNYTVQTSNTNNGTDWVTIKTVTNNTVLTNDWTGLTGSGRYIRIYGTVRGTGYGYSIFELEVYGTSPSPVATTVLTTESVNAFPNPAQDYVNVSFTSEAAIASTAELVVFDQFSQAIATYTKASGADVVHINTSSLQSGVYLIKINACGNYSTKRILINR
ncbi:MAG: discoidin domain-containing protein [Cytophagales bacterium]|nr:discoidin domain-containing protein [Cytophaga sp.]